ncbi:hypothetical protein [Oceanimonas sp. CAM02]|uniref:hypothetical protein n=1 Tax=Oceanimonas sp. CAM02 TaxID=3080336 RepID=UPI002936A4C6|nr:hypothetical protein [Oceanimonas sp. CAM02]MDV2858282.1 hypothetical protein [Oceanimonas sp. CAM02]
MSSDFKMRVQLLECSFFNDFVDVDKYLNSAVFYDDLAKSISWFREHGDSGYVESFFVFLRRHKREGFLSVAFLKRHGLKVLEQGDNVKFSLVNIDIPKIRIESRDVKKETKSVKKKKAWRYVDALDSGRVLSGSYGAGKRR